MTERRQLAAAAAALLLLLAGIALAGSFQTRTGKTTVTTTPVVIGDSIGRDSLRIGVLSSAAGGVDCGPSDEPASAYYSIAKGAELEFGEVGVPDAAAHMIECVLTTGNTTPVSVSHKEEGEHLPAVTQTPTITLTPTATLTATATATATDTPA